ncbi:MAG: RsmE family RNA methyltransferase [Planctomycetota bacterium]
MANRYFLADLPPPGRHPLPDALAHHLGRVLRARVGDELQLGDGRGGTALATIAELDRRGVQVEVAGATRQEPPPCALTLAFAVPRLQRVEWLLEHGTEVGVAAFQPIWTQRTRPTEARTERCERIVAAAAGRCDRPWLPQVLPGRERADLLASSDLPATRYVARADGSLPAASPRGPAVLLVGPEGGFTADEAEAIAAAGCRGLRLGRHVLRTETAALVGAAVLLLA